MKHIVLIMVMLVAALGLVGVSYAMWSDTVIIKTTINTGSVDTEVMEGFSSTYVWKTQSQDMLVTDSAVPPYNAGDPAGTAIDAFPGIDKNGDGFEIDPVSYATAEKTTDGGVVVEDAVTLTFSNLFPLELEGDEGYCTDFTIRYYGTIPAHIATNWRVVPQEGVDLTWAEELINYHATITMTDPVSGEEIDKSDWDSFELYEGDICNVKVCIDVPQTLNGGANSQPTMSGKSFELEAKIMTYQWNEPEPTVNLP